MKNTAMVAGIVLAVIVLFVAADYFSFLGTTRIQQMDLILMNFNTVDAVTHTPVEGVRVRCFQSNNNDACSERHSNSPGVVSIAIPVIKIVTRSHFFVQNATLQETVDPELKIMFVHPDYANPIETYPVSELSGLSARTLTVSMSRTQAKKY